MSASEPVRRLFERYASDGVDGALDEVRFDLREIRHETERELIGVVTLSGVGAATRIQVEQDVLMTFAVEDGLITQVVSHPTLESARAELGLTQG